MTVGGLILAGYAVLAVFTTYPAPPIALTALFVFLFVPGILISLYAQRCFIATSAEGIIYQSLFYALRTPWSNVEIWA